MGHEPLSFGSPLGLGLYRLAQGLSAPQQFRQQFQVVLKSRLIITAYSPRIGFSSRALVLFSVNQFLGSRSWPRYEITKVAQRYSEESKKLRGSELRIVRFRTVEPH